MEPTTTTQNSRLPWLFGLLAVAFVAAAIWVAAPLAAGGSGGSESTNPTQDPVAGFVQDDGDGQQQQQQRPEDCPERDGEQQEGDDASADV